jgi:hypothetical protein
MLALSGLELKYQSIRIIFKNSSISCLIQSIGIVVIPARLSEPSRVAFREFDPLRPFRQRPVSQLHRLQQRAQDWIALLRLIRPNARIIFL